MSASRLTMGYFLRLTLLVGAAFVVLALLLFRVWSLEEKVQALAVTAANNRQIPVKGI